MSALNHTVPTLADLAGAMDQNGRIKPILELLMQHNEMLDDMAWIESNKVDGHDGLIRTGIPEPIWAKINQGVPTSVATQAPMSVGVGRLEDYSQIDKRLADKAGNRDAYRLSQDKAKLQGFNNKLQRYVLFGNSGTEPEAITGLAPYFNDLNAANGENIIDAGGTGSDNNSIWLVVWGGDDTGVAGIYPKGSQAGFQMDDLGEDTAENVNGVTGTLMQVYRSHYSWDCGLWVGDWRQVVRLANIDKSNLTKDASGSSADLCDLMQTCLEQVYDLAGGNAAFYMSRRTRSYVRKQATNATKNSTLTIENVGGKRIMFFQEVPMRRVDALAADETRVIGH